MPTPIIFRPRINNYDMNPAFYDNNYTPTQYPTPGTDQANPYNINSSNSRERESAYLWGRWYETLNYPATRHRWTVDTTTFNTITYKNGVDIDEDAFYYNYWVDPSIYDYTSALGDVYHYEPADNIGRYLYPYGAQEVGDIVTFIDIGQSIYFGGVVERFRSSLDYDISYLDTTQHIYPNREPVHIMTITNNNYQGVSGQAIKGYWTEFDPVQNPLIIGKPIGAGKFTILYNKRYQDQRKGLTI